MKNIKFIVIFLMIACRGQENAPDAPKGNIEGSVVVVTDNSVLLPDKSGVQVTVKSESDSFSTVTDATGKFDFTSIPSGMYTIDLLLSDYLVSNSTTSPYSGTEFNVPGENDTVTLSYGMYQIPDVIYHIDSGEFDPQNYGEVYVYGTISNDDDYPDTVYYYHQVICFMNEDPDVSSENYLYYRFGIYTSFDMSGFRHIRAHEIPELRNYEKDSLYIRIYPVSKGDDPFAPLRPEAMGTPSNTIRIAIR